MKRKTVTKTAIMMSACLMIFWAVLGTGTSIAWFKDESPTAKNVFDIGELDLVVSHKVGDDYKEVKSDTKVFDEEALYEPGYVQVIYLKIENQGDVDFDYKLSVVPDLQTLVTPKNVYGHEIYLPRHLEFGVLIAEDETTLQAQVADRSKAEQNATLPLSAYTSTPDTLSVGEEHFAAVILRMPKEVGNAANYRGNTPPSVELGITVKATQVGTEFKD